MIFSFVLLQWTEFTELGFEWFGGLLRIFFSVVTETKMQKAFGFFGPVLTRHFFKEISYFLLYVDTACTVPKNIIHMSIRLWLSFLRMPLLVSCVMCSVVCLSSISFFLNVRFHHQDSLNFSLITLFQSWARCLLFDKPDGFFSWLLRGIGMSALLLLSRAARYLQHNKNSLHFKNVDVNAFNGIICIRCQKWPCT